MRIRIISGSYGLHDGRRVVTMTARSGAFEVEDAEARALISAGVAEQVALESEVGSRESEVSQRGALTGTDGGGGGAPSDDGDIVTPAAGGSLSRATEADPSEGEPSVLEDGAETPCYEGLSAAELRGLCDERGIALKKNATAKALRKALEQYDAEVNIFSDRLKEEVCAACEVPPDVFDAGQRLPDVESDEDGIMPELVAADPVDAE